MLVAGFAWEKVRCSMPWLLLVVTHGLPASMLMAVSHQAVDCPLHKASTSPGLLCVDLLLLVVSSVTMHLQALHIWQQLPPPAWDGAPIHWRAGPEHAAACISGWCRHARWYLQNEFGYAPPNQRYIPSSPEVAAAIFGSAGRLEHLHAWRWLMSCVNHTCSSLAEYAVCSCRSGFSRLSVTIYAADVLLLDVQVLGAAHKPQQVLEVLVRRLPSPTDPLLTPFLRRPLLRLQLLLLRA